MNQYRILFISFKADIIKYKDKNNMSYRFADCILHHIILITFQLSM